MDRDRLEQLLRRIDGRPYPAYRDLRGEWQLGALTLRFDHIQGDPFAAPSRLTLITPCALPPGTAADLDRRLAAEDWLLRRFGRLLQGAGARRGSGKSGAFRCYRPGPEIVERSGARVLDDGRVCLRFSAGLPARGRRILGRQAQEMLLGDLPRAAAGLREPDASLPDQIDAVCVQRHLRRQLRGRGLVAFVADGAVLPRRSGIDPRPLPDAVPFDSPPSMRVTLESPDGQPIAGMGVPAGVTLIAGGGFHGKSTLLQALQRGWMDHVPGDGRERVVSDPDAVKIRAEDGRRVAGVDISPFLRTLPGGRRTDPFWTDDASGSTSQAAALVEAAEAGARVVLLDEDTSATNLLVRDERMRALIPREREPITPLVERVRQLHAAWGISAILVVGGVGDFLAAADQVILMSDWRPSDATERARAAAGPPPDPPDPLPPVRARVPLREGLDPGRKVRARDERRLGYGGGEVELGAVEQVIDPAHAATLGHALGFLHAELVDGETPLPRALDALDAILDDEGVEALSPRREPAGDLIRPRRHEVAAALNRLRTLTVRRSN